MKKYVFSLCICLLGLTGGVLSQSFDTPKFTVNGHLLSGSNFFKNSNAQDSVFDFAYNMDMSIDLGTNLTGFVQFQGSQAESPVGFSGPTIQVTDLSVAYMSDNQDWSVIGGTFDAPFGYYISYLSNNADMSTNFMITNPLIYDYIGGVSGVKLESDVSLYSSTIAVFNGLKEEASEGDNIGGIIQFKPKFSGGYDKIGLSLIYSNDDDTELIHDTIFSGWMLDYSHTFNNKLNINSYYAGLTFNDQVDGTDDKVKTILLELMYPFLGYNWSLRYDAWIPEDHNGTGAKNEDLPLIGFSSDPTRPSDQTMTTYLAGLSKDISEQVLFKSQAIHQKYEKSNQNVSAILSYFCFSF